MVLRVDKAGRVVLPKPIRDHFGLRAGSALEVTVKSEGVVLTPERERPALMKRGGLLVHTGEPEADLSDLRKIIEEDREERMRRGAGW